MHAPPFHVRLLAPTHWPTWIAIGLLRALCLLPIPLLLVLGEALGTLAARLSPSRRRVALINFQMCFPDKSAAEHQEWVAAHFKALGVGVFEAGLAWWASDARLRRHCRIEGREHLEAVRQQGRGMLLLTGHFTTLELGARLLCLAGQPFHAMYRPYNNAVADFCMHRWREAQSGLPALPRDELRPLVRALREGRAIWYAPDQTLDPRASVFAPFFGVPTLTLTATSKLAQIGRAAVVPYFPARDADGWCIRIQPALDHFPGDDETADAARVNAVLERGIEAALPQYFWTHRRFKRQPPGARPLPAGY